MKIAAFPILALVLTATTTLPAPDSPRVLPEDFNADRKQQMMRSYLRRQVHGALDARLAELEAVDTPEQARAYREEKRDFLRALWGEIDRSSPLRARRTGILEAPGHTIEKIVFESHPGLHVTGNLYRPEGEGPFPAILHPCGHSENGKAAEVYQKASRLLARHGFVVFCYDPVGQGERKQIFDEHGEPVYRASREHQRLGTAPILLGRDLAFHMVRDGVRALDYLESRPDVDAERLGCTGNSGGGNLTSYLMAFDDRILAAAPGCFMTTHRRKNENPGPGDAEQNLHAQIREGFDHPDFILARASEPTLILAATRDFVPIEGTWEAFRQAKRIYTILGYPERIDLVEANEEHGFSKRLREGAVRFFARWLQDRHCEAFEGEDVTVFPEAELQCTPEGRVTELEGARTLFDLYAERERELAAGRPPVTRRRIREATGIRPLAELPEPEIVRHGGRAPEKLELRPEPGITLPALFWDAGDAAPVLMAHGKGKDSAIAEARRRQDAGHPVLLVDVRDTGETRTRNWRFPGADWYIAYMLGRSFLAMRTEDLLVAGRWLAKRTDAESIDLVAWGEAGPPALHAAALEPDLVASRDIRESLSDWRSLVTSPDAYDHLHSVVPGALATYDLPDLRAFIEEGR